MGIRKIAAAAVVVFHFYVVLPGNTAFEQAIAKAQAKSGPGGAGEASANQSVGAPLHHQPTPNSVQSAERVANADGDAALERARAHTAS